MDRDEAQKTPVVIPPQDIKIDPECFLWYTGFQGGGFKVSFKKYKGRLINDTPMHHLNRLAETSNEKTKLEHKEFFDAVEVYFEGLMEYAKQHYADFVVPFGCKHIGKLLRQFEDDPWLKWTMRQPILTNNFPIYFTAIRFLLADKGHHWDTSELLRATAICKGPEVKKDSKTSMSKLECILFPDHSDNAIDDESRLVDTDTDVEYRNEGANASSDGSNDSGTGSCTEDDTSFNDSPIQRWCSDSDDAVNSDHSEVISPDESLSVDMALLGSLYRLDHQRRAGRSPSPVSGPPSLPYHLRELSDSSIASSASSGSPVSPGMFQKGMGKEIGHPEGAQRRTQNSEREFSVKTNRHKQRREYLPSDIEDFIFTEGEDEDGSDEYIDSPTENDFSTDTEDSTNRFLCKFSLVTGLSTGVEPRQLRPRKRAPDNSPCDFKRMLSAESSLSSIATKLSSGITEVHSDNDELSSVIEISLDSESEEDEHSNMSLSFREYAVNLPFTQGLQSVPTQRMHTIFVRILKLRLSIRSSALL
ncbi:uncharacterized protein ARMOST_18763 [Armillaria ostoyae]|uniref:Uncharacterized protein n=1 Tax=Armillaria ostoyae TaxID=47428 RepID=A0A284S2M8_ARMOS|nr:uncharacterized protein ARMOST_18763 [Armillaria ostoyae]